MFKTLLLAAALVFSTVSLGDIVFEFNLDAGEVGLSSWMGRDAVSIPGGVVPFGEGLPSLPGVPYSFVLPQGTSIGDVSVEVHSSVVLEGDFDIAPVTVGVFSQPLTPSGQSGVYLRPGPFPETPVEDAVSGSKSGFRVGGFVLVPFTYYPLTGELSMITSATVTVDCVPDGQAPAVSLTPLQTATAIEALQGIVANPEMLQERSPGLRQETDGDPVWVAIGDASMEPVLQPLVDHRNLYTGPSEFVTVDWITSNYTGYDTPEKIRNYLKDQFYDHSLIYALMVGDYGETTRISHLTYSGNTVNNVTDHYYMDLDSTWDGNGNHLYGETGDGIDYYTDIYVGRFSSDNPVHVGYMVDKTLAYELEPVGGPWQKTAVLIGAGLWPPDYWGSFVCDDIASYIPAEWTVEKLYETSSGHPNNQLDLINDGASYVTPMGHGGWTGIYWYYSPTSMITVSNYTQLENIDMLPVFHSIACMAGELTASGCLAERLMFSPWGGGVAVMFNSSYGWGTPPSRGPSEWLEVMFAEHLFEHQICEIGITQGAAKDAIQPLYYVPLIDWVTQVNNLLGDPALFFIAGETGIEDATPSAPSGPAVLSPRPNPSAGVCAIPYDLPAGGHVTVTVYDLSGRSVAEIHSGPLPEGQGSLSFDGTGDDGRPLPAGCYSVVMNAPAGTSAVMMVLAR